MMALKKYLLSLLSLKSTLLGIGSRSCRCLSGEDCWPSSEDFSTLSTKLSQPLLHPVPVASACYPSALSDQQCAHAVAQSANGTWRAEQPGALQSLNLETYIHGNGTLDACYLDVKRGVPCTQGSLPTIGVDARNYQDVQQAVLFAGNHNLRLVIKNTGHDFMGRSSGRGGFMLWTHHMKEMSYNKEFIPSNSPAGDEQSYQAFTLGAGVQWSEAYAFADQHKRVLVGGISVDGSVGAAGGWILGGGHSVLSPSFGLGVDNALQFTVVLADGAHVVANAFKHSDLFWALRGGGPGTYGVVTSVTYKSYPSFPVTMINFDTTFSSPSIAKAVFTNFIESKLLLNDAGWGGYSSYFLGRFDMRWLAPNTSLEDTKTIFGPYEDFMNKATDGKLNIDYSHFDSYYEWFDQIYMKSGPSQVGSFLEGTSRLIPRSLLESNPEKVAEVMNSAEGLVGTLAVAGGAITRIDPSSTGATPSWRNAATLMFILDFGSASQTLQALKESQDRIKRSTEILDALTLDSASYLNEASLFEKDPKKSFYGDHYSALLAIRQKYDPESLLVVAAGVGSDEWDEDLRCRLGGLGQIVTQVLQRFEL